MISREIAKQENSSTNGNNNNNNNFKQAGASSSATTSWSRLKDPRIVRVSRAFGGKDRHSKVCTVRGLRDRRVRLSVPTAIQLYDLQDRLGLNQPSKVVDWLLNAAKSEIDELPPLQFPQGTFGASLLPMLNQDRSKEEIRDENWGISVNNQDFNHNQNQNQNQNPSLLPMNTSSVPFNSFVRWDPSNLTLSHPPPRSPNCSSSPHQQPEDWHNFSLVAAPLPPHHPHHHQVLVYQPAAQPYFQSQISASNAEFDTTVESSTHFNMTANLLPSQNNDGSR